MSSDGIKTVPTKVSVQEFLASLETDSQRRESQSLIDVMSKISEQPPVMWGPSIIGFDTYHYVYDSGREGDMPRIGFSPRKGKFALYITYDASQYADILERLGKHKTSKACIYINKLSDVDMKVLEELITKGYQNSKMEHPSL